MSRSCFIFAGEPSGDLHGGHLMRALRQEFHFWGVGGKEMRAEGVELLLEMEQFRVMGFIEVLKNFMKIRKNFYLVLRAILEKNPDCVLLIDFPGFNLRLASALRKRGYRGKIVHYICPAVWAHGKGRIAAMASSLDLLLTIYPFEKQLFQHTGLRVEFIGNPLLEEVGKTAVPTWNLPKEGEVISLFPGSRKEEIQRHTHLLLAAAALIKRDFPHLLFALSCSSEESAPFFETAIQAASLRLNQDIYIVESRWNYALMERSKTALAKSGTVTLELAFRLIPTVVIYAPSLLNYLIAKKILRISLPFYCIVNILAGREIFPEIIQTKITPEQIARAASELHTDPKKRNNALMGCEEVKACSLNALHISASEMAALSIKGLWP